MNWTRYAGVTAILALATVCFAADGAKKEENIEQTKQQMAASLVPIKAEAADLKAKAKAITKEIGKITSEDDVTEDSKSVKTLQDLVKQLAEINEKLAKLQESITEIQGWIEGQTESLPVLMNDVDLLKRVGWGNYVQFQWSDTQEGLDSKSKALTTNDAFQMRRFRISTTNKIDPKTSAKLSFDVSAGSVRTAAELKDAMLMYDIVPSDKTVGIQALAGQMPIPLGYELERSSSEREFPERTLYNRTMFNGERGRGAYLKYGLGEHAYFHGGLWNSLTVSDAQTTDANTYRNLNGTDVAYHAGLRYYGKHYDLGVSGFAGDRAAISSKTTTSWTDKNNNGVIDSGEVTNTIVPAVPGVTREFLYLDGAYVGFLLPNISLRGEYMTGKDRVPTLSSGVPKYLTQTNILGWQAQLSYALNNRNLLSFRYESFDPNTAKTGDTTNTYGLAYSYWINPGAKLTISHEVVQESTFNPRNDVTTIRLQFKL